jgi:hypothetical protein
MKIKEESGFMGYIQGLDRNQMILFSETINECIREEYPNTVL